MPTKDLSPESLTERRLEAVRLRLDGHTVAEASRRTGLSAPTVSAAWKAFKQGGWAGVPLRTRGRPAGHATVMGNPQQLALWRQMAMQPPSPLPAWNSKALAEWLDAQPAPTGASASSRAIEHWWETSGLVPRWPPLNLLSTRRSTAGRWYRQQVQPVLAATERAGGRNWHGGVRMVAAQSAAPRRYQLYLFGKRGALHMRCLSAPPRAGDYLELFARLLASSGGKASVVFHGAWFPASAEIRAWLGTQPDLTLVNVPAGLLADP